MSTSQTCAHAEDVLVIEERILATHGPFRLTSLSAEIVDRASTFEEWIEAATWAQGVEHASPWWVADLLVYGEDEFGERYAQAIEATGLKVGTLMNMAYVARYVAKSRRREGVPFTFYQDLASLPAPEQEYWLNKCEEGSLTRSELRAQLKKAASTGDWHTVDDWWLMVHCEDAFDMDRLVGRMESEGRAVKAVRKEKVSPKKEG